MDSKLDNSSTGRPECSTATKKEDFALVVEVRGRDGAFQCGRLVAASKSGGLLVDFLCPGRRNEWVPFAEAFLPQADFSGPYVFYQPNGFYGNGGYADPVEVLMQHSPSDPWTWYPAITVYDWNTFGWVSIQLPGGDIRTIVPRDRIRCPTERYWLARGLVVTYDYMKSLKQFYAKSVLRPVPPAKCSPPRVTAHTKKRSRGKPWKTVLVCGGRSASPERAVLLPTPARDSCDALRILPVEILTETFQCLPTVEQCRLRTVCIGWNGLLTSAAVKRLLHIQFPSEANLNSFYRLPAGNVYVAAACALRCWSNRAVAIVGTPRIEASREKLDLRYWSLCDGRLLQQIMPGGAEAFPGILILKDIDCSFMPRVCDRDYIAVLHTVFDSLAAICRTLAVKNFTCTVQQVYYDGDVPITIRIPFGRMRNERRLTVADWWDMIEQACPLLDSQQRDAVSTALQQRDLDHYWLTQQLTLVARRRQCNDPRKSVTYLKPFPRGDNPLGSVDVNQLTRLAQYLMLCHVNETTMDCQIVWPDH